MSIYRTIDRLTLTGFWATVAVGPCIIIGAEFSHTLGAILLGTCVCVILGTAVAMGRFGRGWGKVEDK